MIVPFRAARAFARTSTFAVALGFVIAQEPATPTAPPPVPAPPTKERLTLATVLQRGPTLLTPPPRVVFGASGHRALVVVTGADGNETLHAANDGTLGEPLVTAKTLLESLGAPPQGPARFPPLRPLDDGTLRLEHDHRVVHWVPAKEPAEPAKVTPVLTWPAPDVDDDAAGTALVAIAPNDAHVAFVRERQLWIVQQHDGLRKQITFDGNDDIRYGTAAHRAEFGIDRGLFWSHDGRFLCVSREDQRAIAPYPYQDSAAVPTKPLPGRYPMAGRQHAKVTLGVVDTTDFSLRWLEHDPAADVYWTNVTFARDGSLVVALVSRGQDRLELVRFDPKTGRRVAVLLEEQDREWVEPEHGPHFLADGRFLWLSSRNGHRHLWLHGQGGAEPHEITKGAFDVQRLLRVTDDGKTVWFDASGEDPRQLHLFAAALDGSGVRQFTRERGTHRAELSADGRLAAITWSNLETPPTTRLVDLETGTTTALPQPADPLASFALPTQRLFQIKADDDTVLYGHVALPPDLQDGARCPVLLYVYGGPHVQLVTDQWFGGAPLWLQAFAAEGYVVCRLDNRGTPHRGIDFEQAIHRRLGVLEVKDQLRAVEWLTQQPFVDSQRIGVHGWSYGGYLTLRLLLAAPTTFACGVSGAPVTDWSLYETGYTERYLDMPEENPTGYQEASCLGVADRLQRPLLLVHGTDDRTVVWAHTLQFVDRCVAAGKQLDYFPYPMQRHRLVGPSRVHFLNLLHDWLGKHLRPEAK